MHPVSTNFKEAVVKSHRFSIKAELLSSGVVVKELDILGGNVTIDKEATNRRQLNLEIVPTNENIPNTAYDGLHPLSGNEIKVYRGITFSDGSTEYVPLGVFSIEDASITSSPSLKLTCFDRSKVVEENQFTTLYFVSEGTNYATAIQDLIEDRRPGTVYSFMNTTLTTPPMLFGYGSNNTNPWESAQRLAEALGAELYFDGDGVCVLRPEPDPINDPVAWSYVENTEAMVLSVDRKQTKDGLKNKVIAFGLNTTNDTAVRVEVEDDDPDSPTFTGKIGTRPVYLRTTMLLTAGQAQDAAEAELRRRLGVPEQVRLVNVVNPAHDVGDVILVTNSRTKLYERKFIIDKLNIPLDVSGTMNIECRETVA